MNFSARTEWELEENRLTKLVRERTATGGEILDLTVSNPTECGFEYPTDLLAPLAQPGALYYEPHPLGARVAREAVAQYYLDHGAEIAVEHLCLTISTSEAYSFLFRLLCDPGDEMLIARPSYPLFPYIAQLDSVVLREYPLHYDAGASHNSAHAWSIDLEALRAAITPRTRAVLAVHPNNPTGSLVSRGEREALESLCAEHSLALIADEVFLDYALAGREARSFTTAKNEEGSRALTFVLSGISKVCGLPQMKASWIAARGPEPLLNKAMERLEIIADTFLSMNAPVQAALPQWLARRGEMQQQIRERVERNLAALDERLRGTSAQRLALDGGWTAVLRVPRTVQGAPFAEAALTRGALVQPGEFYGFPEGRAVISLLTRPDVWERGLALLPIEEKL